MESHEFDDVLTRGVRRMAAEARERLDEHPTPDTLCAYDAEELSEKEAARVRAHLAVCKDCARTVLDLAAFPQIEPRPGVEPLSPEDEETQWQRVLERIAREEPAEESRDVSRTWTPLWGRPLQLVTAALAVACIALAFWIVRLQQEGTRQEGPTANVFVVQLVPMDAPVARGEDMIRIPAGMRSVLLVLTLADLRAFDDFEATLRRDGPEGEVVWEKAGLVRGPEGYFSVSLPRDSLPAGRYRLVLEGVERGSRETLARYDLRMEYED